MQEIKIKTAAKKSSVSHVSVRHHCGSQYVTHCYLFQPPRNRLNVFKECNCLESNLDTCFGRMYDPALAQILELPAVTPTELSSL
jgi:hypothetical protein